MGGYGITTVSIGHRLQAYPMIVLLLPLVAAILICDRFYPLRQPWHKTPPNAMQTLLYQRLADGGLQGDELATVGALTLGYKEDLEPELKRHFQASGAAHVLAVSGLHTGIIYGLLLALLTLGGRFKPRYENRWGRCLVGFTLLFAMWAYAWLTGMTPSVVRAVLMVSLYECGKMTYRNSPTLNTIAAAAVLILLVRPQDIWSISFQLSFAATAAIVMLINNSSIFRDLETSRLQRSFRGKIVNYGLGIILVSLAAQLGTMPITMYHFHQFSCYFLLTNLIVLPIASLLVPCGLVSIALGGSAAGIYFSKITWALSWAMNHSVEWIEGLPGSTVSAHINGYMILIYYVLLLLFIAFLPKK